MNTVECTQRYLWQPNRVVCIDSKEIISSNQTFRAAQWCDKFLKNRKSLCPPVLNILAYNEEVRLNETLDDLTVPLLTWRQLSSNWHRLQGWKDEMLTLWDALRKKLWSKTTGGWRLVTTSSRLTTPFSGLPGPEPGASSPFFSIPLQFPVLSCSPGGPAVGAWGARSRRRQKNEDELRSHNKHKQKIRPEWFTEKS